MVLATNYESFNLPVVMFEDKRFKELSLSAIVLYAVLADGLKDTNNSFTINEIQLQRFLAYTDEMYKNAKNQLKKAQILIEIVQNNQVSFVLDTKKVGI